jgi:hypothetical protein
MASATEGRMDKIAKMLKHDTWAASEGERDDGPFIIRFRTPIVTVPRRRRARS